LFLAASVALIPSAHLFKLLLLQVLLPSTSNGALASSAGVSALPAMVTLLENALLVVLRVKFFYAACLKYLDNIFIF